MSKLQCAPKARREFSRWLASAASVTTGMGRGSNRTLKGCEDSPLPGCEHLRYGNPGLRSLCSLNPGLNSQHASGVLRLTFQRHLVFPLPLRLKNV